MERRALLWALLGLAGGRLVQEARGMKVQTLVIHHSAGASGNVETFRRLHKAPPRRWSDVAYHAVICNGLGGPDGEIQAGRPETRPGAGVYANNGGKLQVCLVGDLTLTQPTAKQLRSLGEWLLRKARLTGARRVVGHQEITVPGHPSACPGKLPLAEIRTWFAANIDRPQPEPLDVFLRGGKAANPYELIHAIYGTNPPQEVLAALNDFANHRETQAWLKAKGWKK